MTKGSGEERRGGREVVTMGNGRRWQVVTKGKGEEGSADKENFLRKGSGE